MLGADYSLQFAEAAASMQEGVKVISLQAAGTLQKISRKKTFGKGTPANCRKRQQ